MTEPRRGRGGRGAWLLAVAALALAGFATMRAREGVRAGATQALRVGAPAWADERAQLESLPALPAALPRREFWIGAWVGPPPDANDAATWRRYAAAGLDVTMVPLEDRYRRADNAARLALLDTLGAGLADSMFAIVRDDSLHPDETTRPGWQERAAAVVRTHAGSRSLAGILVVDEPTPDMLPTWAPLARRLAELDPARPPYVNFAGLSNENAANAEARGRWRGDLVRAIETAGLAHFTFDAYPFRPGGETPNYLASLREAARASHATRRPFGVVVQWTGHWNLAPVTAEDASYAAMEAIAHGATGLVWFTYWTPNPREEPWRWKGGAIEYDGTASARLDTLAALNRVARAVAAWRGPRPMLVVHVGGGLPRGFAEDPERDVPGVVAVEGGAASIAFAAAGADGSRRYLVVDRARAGRARLALRFAAGVDRVEVHPFDGAAPRVVTSRPGEAFVVPLDLPPGGAAGLTAHSAP